MNGYNARVTLASDEGATYAFNVTWPEDEDMPRETLTRLWDAAQADYARFVSMEITRVSDLCDAEHMSADDLGRCDACGGREPHDGARCAGEMIPPASDGDPVAFV